MKKDFKPTGLCRPMDPLGRVVIPKEFRDMNDMKPGDKLAIFADKQGNLLFMPTKNLEEFGL